MKEFLFRGFATDTGEWVSGSLLGNDVIVPCGQLFHVESGHIYDTLDAIVVDPETVEMVLNARDRGGDP